MGKEVGASVGNPVGIADGLRVGLSVGLTVGFTVGFSEGFTVGAAAAASARCASNNNDASDVIALLFDCLMYLCMNSFAPLAGHYGTGLQLYLSYQSE